LAIGNGSGNGHRPKIAERVSAVGDKTRSSQAWNSIFRPGSIYRKGYTDSPRNRSYVIMNNVLYHLHPVKVKRHAVKVSYTLCLGGLSFFLFILLTVTGIFLMFFYRPTAAAAWPSVRTLETAVTFGSLVRNMLIMYLRPLFVRKIAEEFDGPFRDLALTPRFGVQGKHIRHIGMSLLGELNEANVVGRLYADSLAVSLTMQLIKHYGSSKDVRIDRGGMAPHKLRKAVAWIDHHLARQEEGRVALRAVAKDVGLSYFHFSRAFKQSMGMTLTNYIAERRIERAKELMKETDLAISEIALRLGFSSQSHFTTSFRRLAGVTPRSFRHAM